MTNEFNYFIKEINMRLYRRSHHDMINDIKRCFFEAQQGWITIALDRLRDIAEEFPNDSTAFNAQGILNKDYLGKGLVARNFLRRHTGLTIQR
ncbi:MAG: hypothetical protein IPO69_22145 [Saprospiraceae bacterium]|nr:hypothetical protein [Saprospiraceae bacterium]